MYMNIYLSDNFMLIYQSTFTYFVRIEFGFRIAIVIAQNNDMVTHFFLVAETNFHVAIADPEFSKTPFTIEIRDYIFHEAEFAGLVFDDFFIEFVVELAFDDEDVDSSTITSTCKILASYLER